MLTINQLPTHLHGEIYNHVIENFSEEETPIGRPIKTDFIFDTHDDILKMIDTCLFLAVDLPAEIFRHVALNNVVLTQMREYEAAVKCGIIQQSFFVTTAEYYALKVLAEFETSIRLAIYTPIRFTLYTPYNLAIHAIENRSVELLQYVIKNMDVDPSIIHSAVECGHIPSIAYLVQLPSIKNMLIKQTKYNHLTPAHKLCSEAIKLPVLKYLRETLRFPWDERVIENAICDNRYDCLKYALENGCPISLEIAFGMALRHSTTDAMRLLIEIGNYIPTEEDMLFVASRGALNHLIYLHELKTPWHSQTVNSAALFKHHTCVDYGIQCGAPYDTNLVELSRLPYSHDIDSWMFSIIYGT